MKKFLTRVICGLFMVITLVFSMQVVNANLHKTDKGTLKTGTTYVGHAAKYSAYMTNVDARGYTKAELYHLGGATVWSQRSTMPSTRKDVSGVRLNTSSIEVFVFGYGLYEHGYTGVSPAY